MINDENSYWLNQEGLTEKEKELNLSSIFPFSIFNEWYLFLFAL